MKFTVATVSTVLATTVTATAAAESFPNLAGTSLHDAVADLPRSSRSHSQSQSHRGLGLSTNDKQDIRAILKERRASGKQNGGILRHLQDKHNRSRLRNQGPEDGGTTDDNLDLGFFSRDLQQNITDDEDDFDSDFDGLNLIERMELRCSDDYENDGGGTCTCSNIDIDAYEGTLTCTNEIYCLVDPSDNDCGDYPTFCITETSELNVSLLTDTTSTCYSVDSPVNFAYCYENYYSNDNTGGIPEECNLEIDGTQCNSCESVYLSENLPDATPFCTSFDCSNVDDVVGAGTSCGDIIWGDKILLLLETGPWPCLETSTSAADPISEEVGPIVTETNDEEPVEFDVETTPPDEGTGDAFDQYFDGVADVVSDEAQAVDEVADGVSPDQSVNEIESAAAWSGIDGIAIAAATVASVFLWMV